MEHQIIPNFNFRCVFHLNSMLIVFQKILLIIYVGLQTIFLIHVIQNLAFAENIQIYPEKS